MQPRVVASLLALVALATPVLVALAAPAAAQDTLPTAEEVQRRWLNRHEGRHFTATVLRLQSGGGQRSTIRRDESEGRERVLLRLEEPRSIQGESWLLLEKPEDEDELFYYSTRDRNRPPRRIRSLKARDPLRGADPILLGLRVGGCRALAESVESVEREGRAALLLTERCDDPEAAFERRRVWLDPETGIATRLEQEREGVTHLVGEVVETREIQGVATPVVLRFEAPGSEPVTYTFETIDYRRPIRASYFELPAS